MLAAELEQKYQERPAAVGITNSGAMIELYDSPGHETWTLVITTPGGLSCLAGAGHNWRRIEEQAKEPEA